VEPIWELLRSAGFWPWLILLVVILLLFGHSITQIKFPGGGGISLSRSRTLTEVQGKKYDLGLRPSDGNVRWSHYVNHETGAIVPSSQLYIRGKGVAFKHFLHFQEHSNRQIAAIQNAIEETAEIGEPGIPRRYEITPQADGGAPTHYLVLTKLPFPKQDQDSKYCTVELRYVRGDGVVVDADKINLTYLPDERYWVGPGQSHESPPPLNLG
jgi:hypothetical protein